MCLCKVKCPVLSEQFIHPIKTMIRPSAIFQVKGITNKSNAIDKWIIPTEQRQTLVNRPLIFLLVILCAYSSKVCNSIFSPSKKLDKVLERLQEDGSRESSPAPSNSKVR